MLRSNQKLGFGNISQRIIEGSSKHKSYFLFHTQTSGFKSDDHVLSLHGDLKICIDRCRRTSVMMNALTLNAERKTAQVVRVAVPVPGAADILVRVHAVALNPVDALYTANPLGSTGRVIGSDFAGTVERVGFEVPSSKIRTGTRVAGFLQGACSVNDRPGAFAELLIVPWDLVWRVPETTSLQSAATVSLCGLTAAQGLYPRLGMPAPFGEHLQNHKDDSGDRTVNVFIYGASTSVGMYAAQLARLSGATSLRKVKLIGAASSARHDMLRLTPYNYDNLVDYRARDWPEQVRQLCGDQGVDFAIDCISENDSVEKVNDTLGPHGKQAIFRSRAGGAWSSTKEFSVEPVYGAVWEGLGVEVQYQGFTVPASLEARKFATEFYQYLSKAADDSKPKLIPNPARLMPGGFQQIANDGFVLLGPGSMGDREHQRAELHMKPVSAEKLVYCLL